MIFKKILLIFFIVMITSITPRVHTLEHTSVAISPDSSLILNGTSTVNTFSCLYNIGHLKNPISVQYHIDGDVMKFDEGSLILDNTSFDCGGKGINKDFHKILKSEEYPKLSLDLKEIRQKEKFNHYDTKVAITIAGVTNNYHIPVVIKKDNDLVAMGKLSINLSDYHLEAPKKLLGLIVVRDKIEILFELGIRQN